MAEVKGTVQVSTDEGKTWVPAKPDMRLGPGAQFRTGFRSSVTCVIPPDQQFTLESLGTVRVAEAAKAGKRVKTDLVMKYGATNYSIEAAGAEHESTIRTPGSTLSVRGTVVRVTDRPGFAPTAESFTGRALFRTARASTYLGRKGGGYARATANQLDSAQAALSQTVVDPVHVPGPHRDRRPADRPADVAGGHRHLRPPGGHHRPQRRRRTPVRRRPGQEPARPPRLRPPLDR